MWAAEGPADTPALRVLTSLIRTKLIRYQGARLVYLSFLVGSTDGSYVIGKATYFLSETIKYAYLLVTDEDPWPADEFMFNTEAHPLPIFTWRD